MHESTQDTTAMHGIDLAREPDFSLGVLRVRPAKCEVEWSGAGETLQRRVMQVLVAFAEARGSVISHEDLIARCWRGLSVSDDAIFRCISKLRKLAAGFPDPPYAIETIPGVGYRLISSGPVEHDLAISTAPDRSFKLRAWAVAALLIIVLAGSIIWNGHRMVTATNQPVRVTVRPFETLSNSGQLSSLATRIPNEVVDALGDSQVAAALSGEKAGEGPAPGLIVTGLAREDGRNTSVDVRIQDGATHDALWSMEFRRDSGQASDLPHEIAARVADIVNMAIFARSADPPLTDNSALSALLQTSDMIRDPAEGAWAQMIERAQGIVARHPDFAFGHSVLAEAYSDAAENIDVPDRFQAMNEAARREANLTLKLDPQDAGAYVVLSERTPPYDYQANERILLRGIQFAKHPKEPLGALYQYESLLLRNVGRLREALSFQLVAQATDEWSPSKMARLASDYANMGNMTAARNVLNRALQRWPNHSGVRTAQRHIIGFYEKPSQALAVFKTLPDDGSTAIWRNFAEAKAAHSGPVTEAAIPRIREAADEGKMTRETEITMMADLGETKQAVEAANSALDRGQELQAWFFFTPVTRRLRQDPDFVRLASRMGLVSYWRKTGKRPDFCRAQVSRNECTPQLLAALNP